jgi:sulfate permease, SulP family
VIAIAGFHAMLAATGTGLDTARTLGLLPQTGAVAGSLPGPVALFRLIDWTAVAWTAPTLAAVAVLSLIGVLLNTSGVELATGSTVEANRELRLTGLANLVIGLFGGLTSFLQAGASVMAHKLGVAARPLVAGQVAVLALAIVFSGQIVALVPVFVAAGLLIFIGLSMLDDWLVATRAHLMPVDWRLVVGIVILTMVVGILPAMAVGLALAILGFAVGYARLPVIRRASDAAQRPSVVDRAPEDAATLLAEGRRIIILHLQGALFFGSIDQMATDIDRRITPEAGLRDIILDLSAIDAVDSAACAGLTKLVRSLASRDITLHLVHVAPEFVARFRRWGLPLTADLAAPRTDLRLWATLDDALEVCEEALLTALAAPGRTAGMVSLLRDLGADDPRTADLLTVLEPVDLAAGAVLIAAGTRSGDVFVLESGRLGVHLPSPQGLGLRVRTMAPGALVGEMAHILGLPRSADVIALTATRVWRMPADRPAALAVDDPGLAVLWATILARALAHKVAQTNRLVAQPRDARAR